MFIQEISAPEALLQKAFPMMNSGMVIRQGLYEWFKVKDKDEAENL
jgi:hypothetical protein